LAGVETEKLLTAKFAKKGREGREENQFRQSNKNGPISGAKFQEANLVGDFRKGDTTYRSGDWSDSSGSDTEKE
jgi:hypothetical protein